jgi:hypothetical protein
MNARDRKNGTTRKTICHQCRAQNPVLVLGAEAPSVNSATNTSHSAHLATMSAWTNTSHQ